MAITVFGTHVRPQEEIKMIGVTIDKRLSWLPHARKKAAAVTSIAKNIKRRLKGLSANNLGRLMRLYAHPVLDYGWVALPLPTVQAEDTMKAAYGSTVRYAVGVRKREHTTPALRFLKWPTWEARSRALRAAYTVTCGGMWYFLFAPSGADGAAAGQAQDARG